MTRPKRKVGVAVILVQRRGPFMVLMLVLTVLTSFSMWLSAVNEAVSSHSTPTHAPVSLPRGVDLALGERVALPDGGWVEFVAVLEDSRCPADVVCVWQGRAVLEFDVTGERVAVTLIGGESVSDPEVTTGHRIVVEDVHPYPKASQPSDSDDYRVTISVVTAR